MNEDSSAGHAREEFGEQVARTADWLGAMPFAQLERADRDRGILSTVREICAQLVAFQVALDSSAYPATADLSVPKVLCAASGSQLRVIATELQLTLDTTGDLGTDQARTLDELASLLRDVRR